MAPAPLEASALEAAVQSATVDNLELGCALIEKAASSKAIRDIDESLAAIALVRQKHRESGINQPFFDTSIMQGRYPAALPESLRPRPGQLPSAALRIYDDFAQLPRAPSGPPPPSGAPPAFARQPFGQPQPPPPPVAYRYAPPPPPGAPPPLPPDGPAAEGATEGAQEVGKDAAASKVPPSSGGAQGQPDPAGLREKVAAHFDEWARVQDLPPTDAASVAFMQRLVDSRLLAEDTQERFLRILVELAVTHCLGSEVPSSTPQAARSSPSPPSMRTCVSSRDWSDAKKKLWRLDWPSSVAPWSPSFARRCETLTSATWLNADRFRALAGLLNEMYAPDNSLDSSHPQVLAAFASAFLALQPLRVPGFAFAWLELVSHRCFMPRLLIDHEQKGWPLLQRLLTAILRFMEPHLRTADLSEPIKLLYKGMLRLFLVLLHDFPEFLCNHHVNFCDIIPPNCIQLRNLVLSAYPRNMRLPDPFTPNLKVDLLPEIQNRRD